MDDTEFYRIERMKREEAKAMDEVERSIIEAQCAQSDLRDQFAIAALAGMLAFDLTGGIPKEFAADAYSFADAMLEARKVKP